MICPICKKEYSGYPALSRKDNKTKICQRCGIVEALDSIRMVDKNDIKIKKEDEK